MRVTTSTLLLVVLALLAGGCEELPPAPEIPNDPPTAGFYINPVAPIYAGQTAVTFNAVGSRDRDGLIVSYVWDFGDGTPIQTTDQPAFQHTFPDSELQCMSRTYGVLLTVVDDRGGRGFSSSSVTVRELPLPTAPECAGR